MFRLRVQSSEYSMFRPDLGLQVSNLMFIRMILVSHIRHYVHCINEWVSAGPSNIRVECLDNHHGEEYVPGIVPKDKNSQDSFSDRIQKLNNQQHLDIDPR